MAIGCMLLGCAAGCTFQNDPFSGTPEPENGIGTVAVIDLDAVARRLGYDKQMASSIKQRETSLNQQLVTVKTSYEQQINDKQKEFGPNPSREQNQVLTSMQKQADAGLVQVRRQAQKNLSNHSTQLIQRFRSEVRPIAWEAAHQRGLSVIVTKNDSVLFDYDTSVDITETVIERMLARQSGGVAAPADRTANRPDYSQ
jgi:Skp family chaperone for outer membrane proteins